MLFVFNCICVLLVHMYKASCRVSYCSLCFSDTFGSSTKRSAFPKLSLLSVALSNSSLSLCDTAQQLRDLSRKMYIEARQSEDIRRDLAGQLRLTTKPLKVGDRAFYWFEDFSKVKADGSKAGVWIKGKVLSIDGGMVALDLGTRIVKVDISKVRKDETTPPDEPGIHIPELPKRSTTKAPVAFADDFLDDGTDPTNCFWNCETKGKSIY